MKSLFFILLLTLSNSLLAQSNQSDKHKHSLHLVELMDKVATPYSIFKPQEYLTARALDRRATQGIEIDWLDLPIDPYYIKTIVALGAPLQNKSKWLNALAVHTESIEVLEKIRKLPFVKSVRPLGKFRKAKIGKTFTKRPPIDSSNHQESRYGLAERQINQLGGIPLHQLGFTGKDVHIGVVDGGFRNVYRMSVFDSLYLENRLLGTHDFVDGDEFVYESSTHGTGVMSIMASKRPNLIVGTAPDASYYMFKTEDVRGEYQSEEFNWVAAMEYADSIGIDVVNSSMGYTQFRDTSMSYEYKDLDGQTTMITQGANVAISKGLIIVNAAGNNGHKDWRYLSAPADAAGVLTVGAVDENGKRSNFSSWGPTSDGRIKPDIAALGGNTAYASMMEYNVGYGEGTSYACPVVTGMVASLKQAFPLKSNAEIKDAVRSSASQASQPDASLGCGIPNFFEAYLSLLDSSILIDKSSEVIVSPNLVQTSAHVYVESIETEEIELFLYNLFEQELYREKTTLRAHVFNKISIDQFEDFGPGVYALKVKLRGQTFWFELVK